MSLTCASTVITKHTLTRQHRDAFRDLWRRHLLGLKTHFPGFMLPSHHLAFHIYEGAEWFSVPRYWWAFPWEHLIGKLQKIPTNHIMGMQL
ncbi:hypothetical protein K435DRAFT_669130 [Dendrothele bispora CBS 962.96]|uniref:Uncharacterized protein n=1 Tax=Dendrothele bispora (strain CBS 962.96) TaxID=1314807 RepID=A0A4S8LWM7_DENBC|nr:hypothetical protein K435DRAFT_669130 [Dendrothele bispora CBS 962.96]